jgi:hypothetical protein
MYQSGRDIKERWGVFILFMFGCFVIGALLTILIAFYAAHLVLVVYLIFEDQLTRCSARIAACYHKVAVGQEYAALDISGPTMMDL